MVSCVRDDFFLHSRHTPVFLAFFSLSLFTSPSIALSCADGRIVVCSSGGLLPESISCATLHLQASFFIRDFIFRFFHRGVCRSLLLFFFFPPCLSLPSSLLPHNSFLTPSVHTRVSLIDCALSTTTEAEVLICRPRTAGVHSGCGPNTQSALGSGSSSARVRSGVPREERNLPLGANLLFLSKWDRFLVHRLPAKQPQYQQWRPQSFSEASISVVGRTPPVEREVLRL